MKKYIILLLSFLFTFQAQAAESKPAPVIFDHKYILMTKVLSQYVVKNKNTTQVKYFELMQHQEDLNNYIKSVENVADAEYQSWSEKQKLAFLFNSYNALTIKLILKNLAQDKDLKSIKKIGGLFTNPWKIEFFKFLGKPSYLDYIEKGIAQKLFDEPRMHFAFNCASIGCPSLSQEAFIPEKLDEQLDQAARNFFKDTSRNELLVAQKTLFLSPILKWYKNDFENSKRFGPMKKFLLEAFPFSREEKVAFESDKYSIEYKTYDWNLNLAP